MRTRAADLAGDLGDGMLELLYPTRCVICDLPGALLCPDCEDGLDLIDRSTACPRCGAPFGVDQCPSCANLEFSFSGARAVGPFDEDFSRMVTVYKDSGERRLAPVIARLMAVSTGADWRSWADVVVFVPASAAAFRRRGFDHMEDVACAYAADIHVPLADVLVRARAADQRDLDRTERLSNAARSFRLTEGPAAALIAKRNVILIDDVFTTGATLSGATDVLLCAGAQEVRAMVFTRVW